MEACVGTHGFMPRPAATAVWLALALCDAQDLSVEGPATYAPPRTVEASTTKAAEAARSASTGTESFTAKGGEHAERVDAPSRQMREGHAHSKSLHEQADTQERRMSALQERIDRLMSRKQKQERKMSALQERMDTPTPRKQKQQQDAGNSAASFLEEAQTRSAMREVEARALREAEAQLGARHRQLLLARRRGSAFEEMAASARKEVIASWEKLEEAKRKEAEEAKQVKLRAGAPTLTSMFAGRK